PVYGHDSPPTAGCQTSAASAVRAPAVLAKLRTAGRARVPPRGEHAGEPALGRGYGDSQWLGTGREARWTPRRGGRGARSPSAARLHTVTPRLVVSDGAAAIAFYGRAFGAQELGDRFTGPDGELIHAEILIGDSVVMITEDAVDGPVRSPDRLGGMVTSVMS